MSKGRPQLLFLMAAIFILYFFGLDRMGLIGPDEPRYASIGREMLRSGDWVTPRLDGKPWFEKPPLAYWLTALGFAVGLDTEYAPRLPVALLSVLFLLGSFQVLKTQAGEKGALFYAFMLGTSTGWLAFSQAGVTDLPMAAAFSFALMLMLGMPSLRSTFWAGAALGTAVLAKGLVPLVLAIPLVAWLLWKLRWKETLALLTACGIVATPWYVLCAARNGHAFLDEFFWKQQFERFVSPSLQHVQPFWFYAPVLLAGLYPWTPSILVLFFPDRWRNLWKDQRRAVLLATVLFGFTFFSTSLNKLPGYLLPLLPSLFALIAIQLAEIESPRWILGACAGALALVPWVFEALPTGMALGLRAIQLTANPLLAAIPILLSAYGVYRLTESGRAQWAVTATAILATFAVVYLKARSYPNIDRAASARPIWRRIAPSASNTCVDNLQHAWVYGLNYYSVTPLPPCISRPQPVRVIGGVTGHPIIIEDFVIGPR